MRNWRTCAAACLAILLGDDRLASALNPALAIGQYSHTAWRVREGFLDSPVTSIAQTPDGYLWLGTESGLFRFDGVRFAAWPAGEREQLPSTNIVKLLAARDGRLWIGTTEGLVSWKDGRLRTYPEVGGALIGALVEDHSSRIWVGTFSVPSARLCAVAESVACIGDDGRFGVGILSLLEDAGRLWVGATSGLWRWTPGPPQRFVMPSPNVNDLMKASDGALWMAASDGLKRLVGQRPETYTIGGLNRPLRPSRLLRDRDGGVWIGTRAGLVHLQHDLHRGQTDTFTRSDGLSGDDIQALYEDREGNVWVATNEGLDRFRELPVTILGRPPGMPTSLASSVLAARDATVWIGTPDGLVRWVSGRTRVLRTADGLPDNRIGTLFEDSRGRIIIATLGGLAVFEDGHITPLAAGPTRIVYGIAEPRPGELWISDQEHGLIRLVGTEVTRRTWPTLGRDDHATALVYDGEREGLWLGFYKGGLAFVRDGTVRERYGSEHGLGGGRVSQLRWDGNGGLWAATAAGLSHVGRDRVVTLTAQNGLPCKAVHWTVEDGDGTLWLSMPCGLIRIEAADLRTWMAAPDRAVKVTAFDSSDGARTGAIPVGFHPPAAVVADGRLLFASQSGVGVIDPHHLPTNPAAPSMLIERVVADRRTFDLGRVASSLALPPLTRDLQIDYTGLSLVAPEKMRFRYRLEGHDSDWQDVGTRRQAFYTDLPPGNYRFNVIASNNSGIWNETGASLTLSVAAAYYQTTWFALLSAVALLTSVWGVHRLRVRMVETHEREISALNERLMKAQEQERIRIAGELHDGVMQEMLAVTMMLGTAKRRVLAGADAVDTLDKAQQKLIQTGSDIRQLSHELHPPLLQDAGLSSAVRGYCDQFGNSSGIPITCEADDRVADLSRGTALALYRIVQEALGNASRHGGASRIVVRLTREDDDVSLTISDDGVGFDHERLVGGRGLGLVMMRERATQLHGTFRIESAPGRGTNIQVVIPFRS